jgi:cell wall-associated NlpC family hydrolase
VILTPYFLKEENWKKCLEEMESWIGTPYRHLTMVKGRGADCTLFLASIWKSCGVLTDVKYEYYSRDWYIHTKDNLVMESLVYHMKNCTPDNVKIIEINTKDRNMFMPGDMLGFSFRKNKIVNHAALWVGDYSPTKQKLQFINCINGAGVIRMTYGSFWEDQLEIVLRVMEKT